MNKQIKFGIIGGLCASVVIFAAVAMACPDKAGGQCKSCAAKQEKTSTESKSEAKPADQKAQLKLEAPKNAVVNDHGRHGRTPMARSRILQND